jgi:hypothetical protein
VSRWVDLLAQGRDVTVAAVGYLVPLNGAERLEPMDLPHTTLPPRPPAGQVFRQVVRAVGSERGTLQLEAGGRGIVARLAANQLASTSYRELRSDQIARRRALAGRAPAKSTRTRVWLFAGDQSTAAAAPIGKSLAETLGLKACQGCK